MHYFFTTLQMFHRISRKNNNDDLRKALPEKVLGPRRYTHGPYIFPIRLYMSIRIPSINARQLFQLAEDSVYALPPPEGAGRLKATLA